MSVSAAKLLAKASGAKKESDENNEEKLWLTRFDQGQPCGSLLPVAVV